MGVAISGTVAEGFEPVRTAFEANFRERKEIGAAVAVVVDGELVVDLWAGTADTATDTPWREDTIVPMFSTSKGLSALAVAHAHSRGLFDYDEPVASYWPAFAQNGKERCTVRQLLSHQAGLCAIDEKLTLDLLGDADALGAVLARQQPLWRPGTKHGYHAVTLGFYESQLIRHADPRGRTLGRYFADEIAAPLDLDFHIGLPADVADERRARLDARWLQLRMMLALRTLPRDFVKKFFNPRSLTARAFMNPRLMPPRYNDRAILALEIPASNGTGTARSVARAYGEFATGGARLGIDRDTLDSLVSPAPLPEGGAFDEVLRTDMNYSLGITKPQPNIPYGSPSAFGTAGAGGSIGFADPEVRMGFCYAMNRMDVHFDDPRNVALRQAADRAARARREEAGPRDRDDVRFRRSPAADPSRRPSTG